MAEKRLAGKRVLLTQARDYVGPATIEVFTEPGAVDELVARRGSQRKVAAYATGREDALFLASSESDFFVGQSIPFSGVWAQ